jgi:hypothetical protein
MAALLLLPVFVNENWMGTDALAAADDGLSSRRHFECWPCGGGIVRLLTSTRGIIRPPADLTSVAGTICCRCYKIHLFIVAITVEIS